MIERKGGALLVDGALTIDTVASLLGAIEPHLAEGVALIDLAKVTEVDSSAVALALEWQRQAKRRNLSLTWTNIPAALSNLANLYGVAELLPVAA